MQPEISRYITETETIEITFIASSKVHDPIRMKSRIKEIKRSNDTEQKQERCVQHHTCHLSANAARRFVLR
jgi:hypothetical protein